MTELCYNNHMKTLQKYIWYNQKAKLDNPETINQILSLGDIHEIQALKKEIGYLKIRQAYLEHPKKVYSRPVLYFINNYVIKNQEPTDERKYLKNTPRHLGS